MSNQIYLNREKLIRIFFFAAFAFVLFQLFHIARPFLTAMLMAWTLVVALFPIHVRLARLLGRPTLAAFIMTIGLFLAAVIPITLLVFFIIREADRLLPTVQAFIANGVDFSPEGWHNRLPRFLDVIIDSGVRFVRIFDIDPKATMIKFAGIIGSRITAFGALLASNILITLLNGIVFLITLFFSFRDGENLLNWALSLIPMESEHKKALAKRAYEIFTAVVMGSFITASAQGLTAMLGFWIAGVKLPVLLGLATGFLSFFGASFLVTVPVAFSIFRESTGWGIFLFIWGPGLVGWMDNFLKPILIGSRARMPIVLIFLGIIGGVKAYGILGFVLGPIMVALFLTFVSLYRQIYDNQNPAE